MAVSRLRFREDDIYARLTPLALAARPSLIVIDPPDLSLISDVALRESLRSALAALGATTTAFLQLHSVYEDTIITFRMSRRFPWQKAEMKKSRHLSLVWFQFINQCYLFREKTKLFANNYNRAITIFRQNERAIDVATKLKLIDKKLGKQIRARGASLHEWYEEHIGVRQLAAIEIINLAGEADGPLPDIEGHYRDVKFFLGADIKQAITFMEDFLFSILDYEINWLIEIIGKVNRILALAKGEGIRK